MRLVMIEWVDSHTDGGWQKLEGEFEDRALTCRSVGWLVLDGDAVKIVAPPLERAGIRRSVARFWCDEYSDMRGAVHV